MCCSHRPTNKITTFDFIVIDKFMPLANDKTIAKQLPLITADANVVWLIERIFSTLILIDHKQRNNGVEVGSGEERKKDNVFKLASLNSECSGWFALNNP